MFTGMFNGLCRESLAVRTCNYVLTCLPNRAKNSNDSIIGLWNAFPPCFPADWRQLVHLYLSKLKKKKNDLLGALERLGNCVILILFSNQINSRTMLFPGQGV